jgi:hypothetical protein
MSYSTVLPATGHCRAVLPKHARPASGSAGWPSAPP